MMTEHRCEHGFLRSVAPCIACDSAERGVDIPPAETPRYNPGRRSYTCSKCGQHGHSKTTCLNNRAEV